MRVLNLNGKPPAGPRHFTLRQPQQSPSTSPDLLRFPYHYRDVLAASTITTPSLNGTRRHLRHPRQIPPTDGRERPPLDLVHHNQHGGKPSIFQARISPSTPAGNNLPHRSNVAQSPEQSRLPLPPPQQQSDIASPSIGLENLLHFNPYSSTQYCPPPQYLSQYHPLHEYPQQPYFPITPTRILLTPRLNTPRHR